MMNIQGNCNCTYYNEPQMLNKTFIFRLQFYKHIAKLKHIYYNTLGKFQL